MKRLFVIFLTLSCLLTFSACDNLFGTRIPQATQNGTTVAIPDDEITDIAPSEDDGEESTATPSPEETSAPQESNTTTEPTADPGDEITTPEESVTTAPGDEESTTEDNEEITTPENGEHESTVPEENETTGPLENETTNSDIPNDTPDADVIHTELPMTEYYQYSHLSEKHKAAYDRMRAATLAYENDIDVSDLALVSEDIKLLYEVFVADNPQYFWISPYYGHTTRDDVPQSILLNYTDGTLTDDEKAGITANRATIDARRAEFEQAVAQILALIDPSLSDYEKELFIHDYLTRTVSYDTAAAQAPTVNGTLDNAFFAYGALIDREGVCEAYTEAFQYLCYRVGINAGQVFGEEHVWNVVQIDGEWYQVDVTWDDSVDQYGNSVDGTHTHFNLTSQEMDRIHPIIASPSLRVPECTATEHAYREAE